MQDVTRSAIRVAGAAKLICLHMLGEIAGDSPGAIEESADPGEASQAGSGPDSEQNYQHPFRPADKSAKSCMMEAIPCFRRVVDSLDEQDREELRRAFEGTRQTFGLDPSVALTIGEAPETIKTSVSRSIAACLALLRREGGPSSGAPGTGAGEVEADQAIELTMPNTAAVIEALSKDCLFDKQAYRTLEMLMHAAGRSLCKPSQGRQKTWGEGSFSSRTPSLGQLSQPLRVMRLGLQLAIGLNNERVVAAAAEVAGSPEGLLVAGLGRIKS